MTNKDNESKEKNFWLTELDFFLESFFSDLSTPVKEKSWKYKLKHSSNKIIPLYSNPNEKEKRVDNPSEHAEYNILSKGSFLKEE